MNYKMILGMALCLLLIGSAFGYGGGGGYIYNKVNKMENNNQLQSFNFKSKISIQQDLTGIFEDVTLKNTERGSISVIESDKFNDRIFRGHKVVKVVKTTIYGGCDNYTLTLPSNYKVFYKVLTMNNRVWWTQTNDLTFTNGVELIITEE